MTEVAVANLSLQSLSETYRELSQLQGICCFLLALQWKEIGRVQP